MEKVISVSIGEIALKGLNRLMKQIIKNIKDIGYEKIYKELGKIYIEGNPDYYPSIINRLKKVFGLVYISPCIRVEKEMDEISSATILAMNEANQKSQITTFKVDTNRSDKDFPLISPEISRKIGGVILKEFRDLKVDVHNPEIYIYIDIKQNAYIYTERIKAYGGLPVGTNVTFRRHR